ncbi:MAG TPA: hypothetical protein VH170_05865 [Chthoniobacterales bacterium]|jgi:hypothetical protein|nr:hypothetical protein [Chthoniobacterales bacterium]
MSDASVSLGLDAKDFDARLASIESKLEAFGASGQRSFDRVTASGDRLLMSSHRVARGMSQFARDAVTGADGATLMASGLEHLERALRLPLGALAGLAIGGVLIGQAAKTRDEYKKLAKEINELLASPGQLGSGAESFKPFEEQLKRVREELQNLQSTESAGGTFWGKMKRYAGDFWTALSKFDETSPEDIGKQRRGDISTLSEAQSDRAQKAADDYARKSAISHYGKGVGEPAFLGEALKAQEDYNEKKKKYGTPGSPDENQLMLKPLRDELESIFKDIAEHIAQANRERAQGTLAEIADRAKPELAKGSDSFNRSDEYFTRQGNPNKMTSQAWWESQLAQQAQQEIQAAKNARNTIGGEAGVAEAQKHMARAQDLMSQIPTLKDSDKDMSMAVRMGVDSAAILHELVGAVKGMNFANK